MKKFLSLLLLLITIDRIIKFIIPSISNITIIKDFFYITPAFNYGAAWSILYGQRLFLIIISIIALIMIYFVFIKDKKLNKIEALGYIMLISGIIGNLIDRVIYGYVIDYLDFYIFGYDFPIFNLADTFIVVSVCLLIYTIIKGDVNGSTNR